MLGKRDTNSGGGKIFFAVIGIVLVVVCLLIAISVFNEKTGKKDDKFSGIETFINIK